MFLPQCTFGGEPCGTLSFGRTTLTEVTIVALMCDTSFKYMSIKECKTE